MFDVNEKCGVFGVYGKGLDVSRLTFFGLLSLQHRGQEGSGIAVSDGKVLSYHKKNGFVTQVFDESVIEKLRGHIAIGHNRYSTSEGAGEERVQPVIVEGKFALAHNGNLPSTTALRGFLEPRGVTTEGRSDSQLMAAAIAEYTREGISLAAAAEKAFPLFTGSLSMLLMDTNSLIALRDECGIKPLSLARLNGGYVVASETCAFSGMGAEFMRDIAPGEMVIIDESGPRSVALAHAVQKLDVFEFVYFARPESILLGTSVYEARERCGAELAREYPVKADVVVPVPETAIPAAIGYSRESGIPFEMGIIKNRYVHRTFIEPDERLRNQGVKMKLTPLPNILGGKRVAVIDDSIVRGTTSRQLVQLLFEAGAKEVHFLVNSPPVRFPDFYGIDTPRQRELIAWGRSIEEVREFLGATSLRYLSYAGLLRGIGVPESKLCTSCFTGMYPIDIRERKAEVQKAVMKQ